ncbi:hypothetical protein NDU88_000503 [Pleurodeles waltl]|uniref:Uncharacterized protein n=1 Tax=Pleurodeles waltl TaxID=8319 RepID=A0AAV7SWQ2_PLEWA|nr:hypothetical protein NDU88_000503 [Pleurodeles waltl]
MGGRDASRARNRHQVALSDLALMWALGKSQGQQVALGGLALLWALVQWLETGAFFRPSRMVCRSFRVLEAMTPTSLTADRLPYSETSTRLDSSVL